MLTLREAVDRHRDWQIATIATADHMLLDFLEPEQQELKAAWYARKIHAENSRDRLTTILETYL